MKSVLFSGLVVRRFPCSNLLGRVSRVGLVVIVGLVAMVLVGHSDGADHREALGVLEDVLSHLGCREGVWVLSDVRRHDAVVVLVARAERVELVGRVCL